MVESLAEGQLAQLRGARAVVVAIWPKYVSPGSLSCSPSLLLSFLFMWHVLFSVFILPLVCHGNCVRCFISTFFSFTLQLNPVSWEIWAKPKKHSCACQSAIFWTCGGREDKKGKRKGHRVLDMATFCGFHQVYNLDISPVNKSCCRSTAAEVMAHDAGGDLVTSPGSVLYLHRSSHSWNRPKNPKRLKAALHGALWTRLYKFSQTQTWGKKKQNFLFLQTG